MKEDKRNTEQVNGLLLRYLRNRESTASTQAEDEVWGEISKRIKKKKRMSVYRWLIPMTAVAASFLVGIFWFERQADDTGSIADVQALLSESDSQVNHVELITAVGEKIKVDEKATIVYGQDGSLSIDKKKIEAQGVKDEILMNQVVVPAGKHIRLVLSDGSRLDVNSGTRVVYPQKFKEDYREIFVEGEIFIDVAHKDNNASFVVKTSLFDVNVLGTAFNVKAYKEDNEAEVVLLRGRVGVRDKNKEDYTLMPNEMIALDGGAYVEKKKVDAYEYISWIDGILVLSDQSLSVVLQQLHRYFGKEIVYDADIEEMPMHGKLDLNEGLPKVLSTIAITAPIIVEERNNIYYIHARK